MDEEILIPTTVADDQGRVSIKHSSPYKQPVDIFKDQSYCQCAPLMLSQRERKEKCNRNYLW